jgi:Spermine/spermidine synthase domain
VLPISVTPNKRIRKQKPIYTAWNTISRVDVYGSPTSRVLVIDAGTAATGINDLSGGVRHFLAQPEDTTDFDSGLAYIGKVRPRVLIIGSGAGGEVLDGIRYGASSITAVEVNPIITDIVTRRMREYWGDLFEQPEVHLVTDEGRSFIRRSREQYDAIISEHTISNAAIASGALSLAENYVLTREAFEDYLDHLSPDGLIFFTRPEAQIPRLVATAREIFVRRGLGDPAPHVYAFRQTDEPGRLSFVAGFVLKKSPLTESEVQEMGRRLGVTPNGTGARRTQVLYSPFAPRTSTIYDSLLTASDIGAVYARSTAELEPATDDRPFFNQHVRWASVRLGTIRDVLSQRQMGRLALEDRPVAEVTLIVLLVQSAVIAAVLILLPLARFGREGLAVPDRWRYLTYFAALGLGFILAEIALLQRFLLFLGQPIYAFAVILGSLLIFTGLGSALSGRITERPRRALAWLLPAVIAVLLITAVVTPAVFRRALGLPFLARAALAVALVSPLGVALGTPFPTGLRVAAQDASAIVAWAWGVNGFFTVIGSVAAMMFGMAFGFTTVIVLAAACYAVALIALGTPTRSARSHVAAFWGQAGPR